MTTKHPPPPFRLESEPCTWFDDAYCHTQLTSSPVAYLNALQSDLQGIADGELVIALPAKQVFVDSFDECSPPGSARGDFRVMPCVVRGPGRTTKTVKIVGSNFTRKRVPERMTVGRALYLDPQENFVLSEFAAFALSSARTGACAAIAHRILNGGRSVTIFGSGPVAWYVAYYLASDDRLDRLLMIDPNVEKARRTFSALKHQFPRLRGGHRASLALGDDSEVAILATDSQTPFFHPAMSTATLVISLGADSDTQSELDPEWIDHATLITDLEDSALIGDLKRWHDDYLLQSPPPFDLISLLRMPTVPASDRGRIVFISTGSALLDNLTIHYLLEKAGSRL